MITDLKPYSKYKDSGVPWLGDVPEHWEVRPLKRIARLNPSKSEVSPALRSADAVFLPMEKVGADGRIDTSIVKCVSDLWNGFTYFRQNDVIVAKISASFENGKGACVTNLPTEIGFGSTEFHVLRPSSAILPEFLYLATILREFRQLGVGAMTGAAQQRVPSTFIEQFPMCRPPLSEQTAIVRFLDYVDRRIRRVIRARQRRIKLLEEYKQALIHQAVTGKIDVRTGKPYPKYKHSGVEWLGEVPEHWEVRRLKSSVAHINEQTNAKNHLYIALEHVESWTGRLLAPSGDVQFDSQVKRFRAGDVLFGKLRPYLAKVVRPEQEGVCVGEFFVLRPKHAVAPRYLEVVLRSAPAIDFVNSSTYGAKMPRADWTFVGGMLFPHPPIHEQTAIVRFLDEQAASIDRAAEAARREIELLKEYRTRLIADVVTGKLDVREAAAKLPDEPAEEVTEDDLANEGGDAPADAALGAVTEEAEP